ncbi:MAG: N-acetylmuramoyl-L-alanine amidase [Pseudomonadota bacterium]
MAALLIALVVAVAPASRADIAALRIMGDGVASRVVIEADEPLAHETFADAADGMRIHVRLPGVVWDEPSVSRVGLSGVSGYHWDGAGLVLTLDHPMLVARTQSLPPTGTAERHRLILDLAAVSEARFASAGRRDAGRLAAVAVTTLAADAPPAPSRKPVVVARGASDKYVVVIDPGHGGKDPGALSDWGDEKTINLKAARTLRAMLASDPRFDVRLTRDDDRFIELEDRVEMARGWGADLFISLHADAARSSSTKGASVYTLSSSGKARADRMAREHDWTLPIETDAPEEVTNILADMLERETQSNSAKLAALLIPELAEAGPILRNTHRNAGFVVLFAPDVPAVLLEMGFLTNRDDARRVSSDIGRRAAMAAVYNAIVAYFDAQELKLAAN